MTDRIDLDIIAARDGLTGYEQDLIAECRRLQSQVANLQADLGEATDGRQIDADIQIEKLETERDLVSATLDDMTDARDAMQAERDAHSRLAYDWRMLWRDSCDQRDRLAAQVERERSLVDTALFNAAPRLGLSGFMRDRLRAAVREAVDGAALSATDPATVTRTTRVRHEYQPGHVGRFPTEPCPLCAADGCRHTMFPPDVDGIERDCKSGEPGWADDLTPDIVLWLVEAARRLFSVPCTCPPIPDGYNVGIHGFLVPVSPRGPITSKHLLVMTRWQSVASKCPEHGSPPKSQDTTDTGCSCLPVPKGYERHGDGIVCMGTHESNAYDQWMYAKSKCPEHSTPEDAKGSAP